MPTARPAPHLDDRRVRGDGQVPAGAQLDRLVHQRPLRRGPRRRHRDLPGRPHRHDPAVVTRGRQGQLQAALQHCPLRDQCTPSRRGRTITIHPQEAILQRARAEQSTPQWAARYRADRPLVERKISHFVRRAWGGRRARTRGLTRVSTDVDTRAAAINWARLAVLGLAHRDGAWMLAT